MALDIHQKRRGRHVACALSLRAVNKQTVDGELNTTRRRWKWLVQGNQNHLCGPLMRSNCCCDWHSTTRHVSFKKGSISSAAQTRTCRLPLLLLLLLWDVAGSEVRGKRSRGGATASSFWKVCGFAIHMKTGGLHFQISPPWDPFSKNAFSGSVWTVGQNDAIHVLLKNTNSSCCDLI